MLQGELHHGLMQLQAQAIDEPDPEVEVGADVGNINDIPLRPTYISHLLNIFLRAQSRSQGYLLSPFQHREFGLCQVGLPPIVLDILRNQVVCTFSTQGPCVCNGSELAVVDQ